LADEVIEISRAGVRFWHKAGMLLAPMNVGFRGKADIERIWSECPLMTLFGHAPPGIAAAQNAP
jgi:hypothetical protein